MLAFNLTQGLNRILNHLQSRELSKLAPHLELIVMGTGDVVYESGGKLSYFYFPTTAIISIQHELQNGHVSEIANVGNEGLLGVSLFMGGQTTPNRAVVHGAGYAYRLPARVLLEEFNRKGRLFDVLLRYTQSLMTQMSQTAVCNSHHSTAQRLCRWLLATLDHSDTTDLVVTHEVLGSILGVRREGITDAAGRLQTMGAFSCRRGHIRVLDRTVLEQQVCECYGVIKNESERLMSATLTNDIEINTKWQERIGFETRRQGTTDRRHTDNQRIVTTEGAQLPLYYSKALVA